MADREARLSTAVIDVLSLVAYRQPASKADIDNLGPLRRRGSLFAAALSRSPTRMPATNAHATRPHHHAAFPGAFGLHSLGKICLRTQGYRKQTRFVETTLSP